MSKGFFMLLHRFVSEKVTFFTKTRNFSSKVIQENDFTIPTFSTINVKLPFNIRITPLDIHKYQNCNKIFIKLQGEENCGVIKYSQNGNTIKIFSEDIITKNAVCCIEAPIKANLEIESTANIHMGHFNGEYVNLQTQQGNIIVNKFQGNKINLRTKNGNISLTETVQAASIDAKIIEKGSISTDKLQGLTVNLQTKQGNISVKSSYCNFSKFCLEKGDMQLENIHRNCEISILNVGNLSLIGFDGKLITNLNNSKADIQISQIEKNSQINMENGELILRLSEKCHNLINILSGKVINKSNIALNNDYNLIVNCKNGTVILEENSWADMLTKKLTK